MQIAALRFKRNGDQEHNVWRIQANPGKRFGVIAGSSALAKEIIAALEFALWEKAQLCCTARPFN